MREIQEHYLSFAKERESHANHVPVILEVFEELRLIADKLNAAPAKGFDSLLQQVQVSVIMNTLTKLVESITLLLKNGCYEGVDPLARVVLEHVINILYLFEGEKNIHSKQFLRNYIDETLKKSKRWVKYAEKEGEELELQLARKKLEVLEHIKSEHEMLYAKGCKCWPNTHDRFLKAGYEGVYATLYSMNSDSIHGLSEDVYNYCLVPNAPEALQPYIMRGHKATSLSMSVYLAMKSVAFYGVSLQAISDKLNESHDVDKILMKMNEIALTHEVENVGRWQLG